MGLLTVKLGYVSSDLRPLFRGTFIVCCLCERRQETSAAVRPHANAVLLEVNVRACDGRLSVNGNFYVGVWCTCVRVF